ncbi:MAG: T9SS type A sorting domain-containing protein [Candidatus Zixiibacteriota bacterium]|nr:MAG: T9SS type A sorting domain-containing protein [candidate division Zixibacteria bacterium]
MLIVRVIIAIHLTIGCVAAQAPDTIWTRTFGGTEADAGFAFTETSDGYFLIAGSTISFGENGRIYFIKVNSYGQTVFERTYGENYSESARSIAESSDGGYILLGYSRIQIGGSYDIFMEKTDINGNRIWTERYVNPGSQGYGRSVLEAADQNIVVAANVTHYNPYDKNIIIMKTSALGDPIWNLEFGDIGEEEVQSVCETRDGGYVVTGWTTSYGAGSGDILLLKTDSNGNISWYRTYGYSGWEGGRCVIETSDGGFALTGRTNSVGHGSWDVFLVKTDSVGNMEWLKTYGGEEWDSGFSVREAHSNGFLLGGYTLSFDAANFDYYLIRTNINGHEIWYKTIGGSSVEYGLSAIYASDRTIYFMGVSWSYGHGSEDIYLVKLGRGHATDIPGRSVTIPENFQLYQNFPNPFNVSTEISFALPEPADIAVEIFDILGKPTAIVAKGPFPAGYHNVTWNGGDAASGVYYYRLIAGSKVMVRKMILLK